MLSGVSLASQVGVSSRVELGIWEGNLDVGMPVEYDSVVNVGTCPAWQE